MFTAELYEGLQMFLIFNKKMEKLISIVCPTKRGA
jgi:hypothetical protein